jgi:uncharacterized protein YrrD
MSNLVGAGVYEAQSQSIGSVDDVLMTGGDHKGGITVISVRGLLGTGDSA